MRFRCARSGTRTAPARRRRCATWAAKTEAIATVDASQKQIQEIVDSLFSFSELAFQELETQRYLTQLLESNGFTVEIGVSGMPSSWWATWGSGEPVIALGSDIDGIPKASQLRASLIASR